MAADKGKQFEYAIMLAAYNRLPKPFPPEVQAIYSNIMRVTNNGKVIQADVKRAANSMMDKIEPSGTKATKNKFYASFRQLGGGAGGGGEPKTDVLFYKGSQKFRCSLKWGDKYQLSSAGINKTTEVLRKVLSSMKTIGSVEKGEITDVLNELEQTLGALPKKGEQAAMKRALSSNAELKARLEALLGTRKVPIVASAYQNFKEAVVKESMTGALLFGSRSDATADYVLNEKELKPIDKTLVKQIADKTYVRLRLKGRGKTETGARLNELVITIEPK